MSTAYKHDAKGWHWGVGDLEASVKYRFYHNKGAGFQMAAFPAITLPTGTNGMGAGHVTAFQPIWAQKDFGDWSLFGGGGYAINPGSGNRDYWTGGMALTRQFGKRVLLGLEVDWQGPDTISGKPSTRLGFGTIYDLPGPLRLLASGGPTFHGDGRKGFHAFAALEMDL